MWQYNYTNTLTHHGVLGMKWGVRRYQNKDGSLTPAGKKKYRANESDSSVTKKVKNHVETDEERSKRIKRNVIIGSAAVAASLSVLGAMYVYKKNKIPVHVKSFSVGKTIDLNELPTNDTILPKGTKFHRISSKSIEDYSSEGKKIYVSYLKEDAKIYKDVMPGYLKEWGSSGILSDNGKKAYEHIIFTNKDVKIPSRRTIAELYLKATNSNKLDQVAYQRFMATLNDNDSPGVRDFLNSVKKLGYNAIVDENDAGNFTKAPLILLNLKDDIVKSSSHRINIVEKIINVITI